jgi:hypothetical protein
MAEVSLEQLIKLSSGSDVERGEELPELPNAGTCICPTKRECVSLREVEPMANATCQRTQIILIWLCVCISWANCEGRQIGLSDIVYV